jgi:hypothetical protein
MSRRLLQGTLIIGALTLTSAEAAAAEPSEAEKRAAAQALFEAARQLTTQGKFVDACPKLLESYRLDAAIGTKFYLADCYEHAGRLASAWTYYLEVVEEAHREGSKDREKFAIQRSDALKPRLPRLVVKPSAAVRAVAGLAVQRDGLPVGDGAWDTPIPVDLGEHTIRATAPGKKPVELRVQVEREGVEVAVEIPMLEALPAAPAIEPAPPPPVAPPPRPVSSARKIAGFAVGGVGVAALGAGIGLGVQAIVKKNASNAGGHCNAADVCDETGHQLRVDAVHAATGSTVLFALSGAALVTGIVLVATAPSSKPKDDGASAALSVGPFGFSIRGRF